MVAKEVTESLDRTVARSGDGDRNGVGAYRLDREFSDEDGAIGAVQVDTAAGGEPERVGEGREAT